MRMRAARLTYSLLQRCRKRAVLRARLYSAAWAFFLIIARYGLVPKSAYNRASDSSSR